MNPWDKTPFLNFICEISIDATQTPFISFYLCAVLSMLSSPITGRILQLGNEHWSTTE